MPGRMYTVAEATAAFWARVKQADGCWLWQGARFRNGYGYLVWRKQRCYAHRKAWELVNGQPVPEGLHVLHLCDTPLCCRPDHLRVGSHADNMHDAASKGRNARYQGTRGEESHLTKLTREKVLEIKRRLLKGDQSIDIARDFNVSYFHVRNIATGQRWGWLLPDGTELSRNKKEHL